MKKYILGIIVVAVVVVGFVLGFSSGKSTPVPTAPVVGGDVRTVGDEDPNGNVLGGIFHNYAHGLIRLGQNQAFWRNTTGSTVFVDLAEVSTIGTASSTMKVFVATSSTATIASDFTTPWASIIDNFPIATSSVATTTSNYEKSKAGRVVRVADGEYVVIQIQAAAASCPTTGGSCESATSTNRGFTALWRLHYHR